MKQKIIKDSYKMVGCDGGRDLSLIYNLVASVVLFISIPTSSPVIAAIGLILAITAVAPLWVIHFWGDTVHLRRTPTPKWLYIVSMIVLVTGLFFMVYSLFYTGMLDDILFWTGLTILNSATFITEKSKKFILLG